MKKLLLLIACALTASMNAMESNNPTILLDKQIQGYTVSTYKEFKEFFKTEPDLNQIPHFEFDQLTPDNCRTVLTIATQQHQKLQILTGLDLLSGHQPIPKDTFYLGLLQTIKDKLETVIPADSIYDKKVSTYSEFQMFFKKQPDLCTIIKFKFSKLTADERAKVFQEAEGQHQGLEELTHMVVLSGQEVKQFKVTPEIILYLEMLKKITDSLAPQLPTE